MAWVLIQRGELDRIEGWEQQNLKENKNLINCFPRAMRKINWLMGYRMDEWMNEWESRNIPRQNNLRQQPTDSWTSGKFILKEGKGFCRLRRQEWMFISGFPSETGDFLSLTVNCFGRFSFGEIFSHAVILIKVQLSAKWATSVALTICWGCYQSRPISEFPTWNDCIGFLHGKIVSWALVCWRRFWKAHECFFSRKDRSINTYLFIFFIG